MIFSPVTIIIPTYNRLSFLKKAIDSVLEQSWQEFELIVVDDGSTDDTAKLVASYDYDITYIYQKNQGPASARNTGIKAARYELLAFLDSDDRFNLHKLIVQLEIMQQHPDHMISHTRETWYRREKLLNQKKKHRVESGFIFAESLRLCVVGISTVMVRRQLFELIGLFDENLCCCEDYDLWLRASVNYPFLLIDQPLTVKEGGRHDQLSVQYRVGMDKYRIRSIQKLLTQNNLTNKQCRLAAAELARKCQIYGNGCLKHGRLAEGEYYLKIFLGSLDFKRKF